MRESTLTHKIANYLKEQGAWVIKTHGSPYTRPGIPDLLTCYKGRFYAFEVKTPGKEKETTKAQWLEISRIAEAGGYAAVVTGVSEVEDLLAHV